MIRQLRGARQPFHSRLLPDAFEAWAVLSERAFSTRLGGWFQEIARMVADQYHPVAIKNFSLTGRIREAASAHIEAVVESMERGKPKRIPSRSVDIEQVLGVQSSGGADRTTISDLHVVTGTGTEMYFEMKTPMPNKDQAKAMKRQILLISALRKGGDAHAYASTAYNPYGDRAVYAWNYANQFLETNQDNLIGRVFWEKIGTATTYEELLGVSTEVGLILTSYLNSK